MLLYLQEVIFLQIIILAWMKTFKLERNHPVSLNMTQPGM
jgi:hypothetical protein